MALPGDDRLARWGTRVQRNLDIPLVLAIILVLFTILVPLPPLVMDFLLVINITLSMVILVTTVYVMHPLDFSVFPSLLLITTFFRLALNVATTRLILSRAGEEKLAAAGKVVEAFGNFVAGSNVMVGFILFVIIFVIQFVVITKGATRISEVAARFTLDAMPGKQLGVDAELNAGQITDLEAHRRRREIGHEADFYGAMDGASKFIRGDAIAGVVIILVNIIGGFIIGFTRHGMSFTEALEVFTRLTIGDGLVTQVPALLISIAAGLLITRSSAASSLGRDFFGQILGNSKALFITAGFLLVLMPTGLPAGALLTGALLCAALGAILWRARPRQDGSAAAPGAAAAAASGKAPAERPRPAVGVEPLEVEIGYGLVPLVDPDRGGNLLDRIGLIREQIAQDLGFVVPPVRIRDNLKLPAQDYRVKLRGVPVGSWRVETDRCLAVAGAESEAGLEELGGLPTVEPASGRLAAWIHETERDRAESLDLRVVEAAAAAAAHLSRLIRTHAAELLSRDEVAGLIDRLKEKAPALVGELVPAVIKPGDVQRVLQNLLREEVSIRDLETILEALGEHAPRTRDPELLTEYARRALARSISERHRAADGRIHALAFEPALEDFVQGSLESGESGWCLAIAPETLGAILAQVLPGLDRLEAAGLPPAVICGPRARLAVRKLLEGKAPGAAVLSFDEIVRDVPVEIHGTVNLEPVGALET